MRSAVVWIAFALCLLLATVAQAQQGGKAKADNSGTNPINFTYNFRIWNETQALPGDNTFSKMTFEYRFPLGKTWAGRFRGFVPSLNLESGQNFHGLGDVDACLLHVPVLKKKWAVAFGLEARLNTTTQTALGSGKTTLGPQAFLVFLNPLGAKGLLFAPAYQYVFHIAGDQGFDEWYGIPNSTDESLYPTSDNFDASVAKITQIMEGKKGGKVKALK